MKIIGGYQDTRKNNEDFAITPFLFAVNGSMLTVKMYGFGICWGFWAVFIGVGVRVPEEYPLFKKY